MARSYDSPFLLIKGLETQLNSVLSALDIYMLPKEERKVVSSLKRELVDARLDIRDYELSETRDEQLKNAKEAKKRLETIRKDMLTASESNIFSAIDVAQLTSQIDLLVDTIR